jgi:transcriptional regulator with XRE-family HTH domain
VSSPSSSVQEAKRALGQRLRELRHEAQLTQSTLAALCGWERTKVTKIESGVQAPSAHDVRNWCSRCGADDQIEDLVATLRTVESAYVEWRRLERVGMKRFQESALPLYEGTRHLRVYHSHVVPGLLQTPGYLRALLRTISRFRGIPDVDDAVAARLDRQRVLQGNLRYAAVIEESVLRYNLGDAEVMAGQLGYLLSAMSLTSVSLAIIPSSVMARPMWVIEGFTMFDSRRVHVELLSAKVTVTRPVEVADYAKAFEDLAAMAVTGAAARGLIAAALADLDAH